ncbi:MAG: hypothetical protein C0P79_006930 [Gammaproteobacteria bacterium]
MSLRLMAPAERGDGDEQVDERRKRARRNALLLGLVAAAVYVGYILLGLVKGIFPG